MERKFVAYVAPYWLFVLFLGANADLDALHVAPGGLKAMYLLFPLQTVACAAVLRWFWRDYRPAEPREPWIAVIAGLLSFCIWVAPQAVLHCAPRLDGFDPDLFASRPLIYWADLGFRCLRLVVIVPLAEEIFWRGFLLRYLVNERFDAVPFGTYGHMANAVVAIGFMLEHGRPDWPAALATGLLYNAVAFRTRSLASCVLAHAITNALLGCFVLATRQWGFW
jgi:CAAX prenyl protease-like protein